MKQGGRLYKLNACRLFSCTIIRQLRSPIVLLYYHAAYNVGCNRAEQVYLVGWCTECLFGPYIHSFSARPLDERFYTTVPAFEEVKHRLWAIFG